MSDTTSDTSAIDEKKEDTNTNNTNMYTSSNIGYFILNVFILFLIILIYYSGSGLLLYACKLAQSNILPTEKHCAPYTNSKPDITPIDTNIFPTYTDPALSMKMNFPYNEYNAKNKVIEMFRDYKNEADSHFLVNYFISIMEEIVRFNYSSLNAILNMLNGLPEVFLVVFGPVLLGIASVILLLVDNLYLWGLWFANMGWFFKTNTNDTKEGKPVWEDVTLGSPFNYSCGVWLVILFVILFFFSIPLFSLLSIMSLLYCLFSCVSYQAQMNGKIIGASTIIKDVLKYYKPIIAFIFSILVIAHAFTNLGTMAGVIAIVTLGCIYYGIVSINMFNKIDKDHLSKVVSYEKAEKKCSYTPPVKEKHGVLYNLLLGSDEQSGGNILKRLKKYTKKYHRH